MKITPLDIRKQEFRKALRGFDCEEVEVFLDIIADEFEKLTGENLELRGKTKSLEETLAEYKNLEETLRDTLITGQKMTDQFQQNARKESELILRDAELKAGRVVEDARREVSQIVSQIAELRSVRDSIIAKIRAICNSQMELLVSFETDISREKIEETVGANSSDDVEAEEVPLLEEYPGEVGSDEDQGESSA